MIRVRGLTDWLLVGYAKSRRDALGLVNEFGQRVQVVMFPQGMDLKELESRLNEKARYIYPNGGYEIDYREI